MAATRAHVLLDKLVENAIESVEQLTHQIRWEVPLLVVLREIVGTNRAQEDLRVGQAQQFLKWLKADILRLRKGYLSMVEAHGVVLRLVNSP